MPYAPPLSFLTLRCFLSVLCFLVWIRLSRVAWPTERRQWLHLMFAGVLLHGGYLSGVWLAVKMGMGAGLSSLIVGLQPVLTAVWLSSTNNTERVTGRQWGGLLLGFAGLVAVVSVK